MPNYSLDEFLSNAGNGPIFAAGGPTFTTSFEIAEHFGKRHDNVLQSIDKLIREGGQGLSPCFRTFWSTFPGPKGGIMKSRAYEIDRLGTAMLIFGFTGSKALRIRVGFLDADGLLTALSAQRGANMTGAATS